MAEDKSGNRPAWALALLMTVPWASTAFAAQTRVSVDTQKPRWTISSRLVGLHIVYTHAPDKAYADGRLAQWAKEAGVGTARYPGGTIVKYWDWKHPTGVMTGDPWDPKWDKSRARPPEQWMSLDEYLDFVGQAGITPLLGVNAVSGHLYGREKESVRRAADMVAYVKAKGRGGAFWYIGNEEAHLHGGIAKYAESFKQHALAMKKVDPQITIFWNLNSPDEKSIATFLKHDGGTSDGLETHGKWPYGGDPKDLKSGSFREWLTEVPLRDRKNNNREWRSAATTYRAMAAKLGRKNYLIADNEYGIGKDSNIKGFDRYRYGILMTDMLQEHFLGNWDMACFWDTVRGDETGLLSPQHGYRLNPFHLGMELLAGAQGGKMLEATTGNKCVYGFGASKDGRVLLFLINKTEEKQDLAISLTGPPFKSLGGKVMQDTPDHWGELVDLPVRAGQAFEATLPPLSFCRIVFEPEPDTPDAGDHKPQKAATGATSRRQEAPAAASPVRPGNGGNSGRADGDSEAPKR